MERLAVKYSIKNVESTFTLDNINDYDIYIDSDCEKEMVQFARETFSKFIHILRYVLKGIKHKVFQNGPYCTNEMRFINNGIYQGNKRLNSRIYVRTQGSKLILCMLYIHKNNKDNKIDPRVLSKLKLRCSCEYIFTDSNSDLINLN